VRRGMTILVVTIIGSLNLLGKLRFPEKVKLHKEDLSPLIFNFGIVQETPGIPISKMHFDFFNVSPDLKADGKHYNMKHMV
jgi:hypothetical protein